MRRRQAVALAVCALAFAGCAKVLVNEWRIARAEALLSDLAISTAASRPSVSDAERLPRAALASAILLARVHDGGPARADRLRQACRLARSADGARPSWGDAALALAFIAEAEGRRADATRELARSYRAAPFLRQGAGWRVATGVAHWSALSGETRARIVNEAVWLATFSPAAREAVFERVRGTPAYLPVLAAWRQLRLASNLA